MRVRKPLKLIAYLVVYGGMGLGFLLLVICTSIMGLFYSPENIAIKDNPQEAWQKIIKDRQDDEDRLVRGFQRRIENSQSRDSWHLSEVADFNQDWDAMERDIQTLVRRTTARHGEPPPDIKAQLEPLGPPTTFSMRANNPMRRSNQPTNIMDELAQQRALREKRRQRELANTSQPPPPSAEPTPPQAAPPAFSPPAHIPPAYNPPASSSTASSSTASSSPIFPALDPQAEQLAREQRLREQQAEREQRLREQQQAANRPGGVAPQPGANNGSQANQPPPGFPATDLSQVKPRDIVFVRAGDKWVEALVQSKRGKVFQVRAFNGDVAQVTIDLIRLQVEPMARTENTLPPALRAAGSSSPGGKKDEEDDDAAFVAKPGNQPATAEAREIPVPPSQPTATGKKPAAEYRAWTDDTGTFQVEAELLSFEFDLVQLRRRSDGKILSLRIEKLSAADQQVVREKFP